MEKKNLIFLTTLFISLTAISTFLFYSFYKTAKKPWSTTTQKSQPWMTVFVHGSFGSLLGFLSLPKVISDKVDGTMYKQINKQMRSNTHFYQSQPMLQKGLVRIIPTFDIKATDGRTYAAFPIIKAYETILNEISPEKEQNYFYTFGWSGLISQNRRRREAIRFYNALSEEMQKFHKRGIYPKIRLLGHSHGGNLCLNLAAINMLIKNKNKTAIEKFAKNQDEIETLNALLEMMNSAPSYENALQEKKQKRYEYMPQQTDLVIDELIMFATPIQPETECLIFSDMFKKVYSFYSDEDFAQRVDWVSTKKGFSNQRISNDIYSRCNVNPDSKQQNKIVQVQVMVEHDPLDTTTTSVDESQDEKPMEGLSPWQQLLSGQNPFVRKSKNPSHKEFWFISWNSEIPNFVNFLTPLPIVILTPLLTQTLEQNPEFTDVDINIKPTSKNLKITVSPHEQFIVKAKAHIPLEVLEEIKQKTEAWRPQNISKASDFEELYKALR